jgi:hypothetical protein
MLADEYILNFISLSAHIQLTEFYQLLLLSSSSVFQIGGGSGLAIIKFQHDLSRVLREQQALAVSSNLYNIGY